MSVCNADPWQVKNNSIEQQETENGNSEVVAKFEDNFTPTNKTETPKSEISVKSDKTKSDVQGTGNNTPQQLEPLPDSANYLQLLERKLQKVQKGAKLLDSLREKKQDCMRTLLESNGGAATTFEQLLELDTPIESGRLSRHLVPVQAVTVGEILHIVKHDALEEQILEEQQQEEEQQHQEEEEEQQHQEEEEEQPEQEQKKRN